MSFTWTTLESPLGPLLLTDHGRGLSGLWYPDHRRGRRPDPDPERRRDDGPLGEAATQLAELLAGQRDHVEVARDPRGTPFQTAVWEELAHVPRGAIITYGELAGRLGRPSAVRAVAGAVGANPLSIVVPCHRVVGADGTLTGYAGGLDRKRWLLRREGVELDADVVRPRVVNV